MGAELVDAAALVALGICAGFAVWFPAGWLARGDENREVLRGRDRRARRAPVPEPVVVTEVTRADRPVLERSDR